MCVWKIPRSVEQPPSKRARSLEVLEDARQDIRLTLAPTPAWDNLVADLDSAAQKHRRGGEFLDYIGRCCFQYKLLYMDPYGNTVETPVPLSLKMETLLRVVLNQRQLHLNRLRLRGHESGYVSVHDMKVDPVWGMKEIYNTWRANVGSWMQYGTLATYNNHKDQQAAHQIAHRAFHTYLFHLSGNKFLLHKLLELPLIRAPQRARPRHSLSTERADMLNNLFVSYDMHKQDDAYKTAVARNEEHRADQLRLSSQIWWAQYNYSQGQRLSDSVAGGTCNFFELTPEERQMVEDFDGGRADRRLETVLDMKARKPKPYRGHGTETTSPSS